MLKPSCTSQDVSRRAKELSLYYSHDILGNLLEASSVSHTLTRRYNTSGLLEKETQDDYGISYSYDSRGNLEGIQFLDCGYYYSYDDANRLIEAKNHSNPLEKGIGFGYNANGIVEECSTPQHSKTLYTYDDASQLIKIQRKQEDKTLTLTHKRDTLGRVQQIVDARDEDPLEYTYDQRGALIEEMQGSSVLQYHYDSAGNRISSPLEEETHKYNSSNQLIEDDLYHYSYDARGNLHTKEVKESKETLVYSFNLFDQLIQIRRYKANLQQVLLEQWEYSYDALNRRITNTYTNHTDPTQDYSHRYLYHNEDIIAILDENRLADNNSLLSVDSEPKWSEQSEAMKGALLATLLHHPSQVDTPLSITNEITGETYHYHSDHQGSITHLTNEDAQVVESFTYDAYGTILAHSQSEETFNPYCYTAREFDRTYQNTLQTNLTKEPNLAVHGLYYYRARYYDARIGRFISSDPIEFQAGDFNFYRYVGNDPVNWVDPSGLAGSSRAPSGQNVTLRDIEYHRLINQYKDITGRYPDTIRAPRPHRSKAEVEGMREEVRKAREAKNSGGNGIKVIKFESSPKHGRSQKQSHKNASTEPKKPQDSLDKSVPLNENTPRRVSANPETGEFSVFDETHPGTGIYHGHARTWNQLSPKMRSALIKAGKATPKGKMK